MFLLHPPLEYITSANGESKSEYPDDSVAILSQCSYSASMFSFSVFNFMQGHSTNHGMAFMYLFIICKTDSGLIFSLIKDF